MKALSITALSAGTALASSILVTILLEGRATDDAGAPVAPQLEAVSSVPEALARRLDRIETALGTRDASTLDVQNAVHREEGAALRREVASPEKTNLAKIESRLAAIERQLKVVGQEPLLRAQSYLGSSSARARREGIELLARYAAFDPAAREAILGMLQDGDASVRREAVQAVGRFGDPSALSSIGSMLADADPSVRREAADSVEDVLRKSPKDSPEYRRGIQTLLAHSQDSNKRVREEIVDAIGDLGAKGATGGLAPMLSDPDNEVREEVIQALARSGDAAAIPHLSRAYRSGPEVDRMDIAVAMARLGDKSAFRQEARRLVTDIRNPKESSRTRSRAVRLLGSHDREHFRAVLEQAAKDEDSRVRRAAERALRTR